MGIYDKLEEIRKKPEHIRLRYVWLMVAISMAFILIIWIISLKSEQETTAPAMEGIDTSNITEQFNQGKESLQNVTEGFKSALEKTQQSELQNTNNEGNNQ